MENDSSVEQKHRLNSQHILTFSMKRKYLLFTIDFQTEFTLSWNLAKIKSIYLTKVTMHSTNTDRSQI